MLDEEMKKFAIENAIATSDMVDPKILISPMFTLQEDEWKRVIYSFTSLAASLQDKLNTPFLVRIIDADNEMNVSLDDGAAPGEEFNTDMVEKEEPLNE